MLDPTPGITQPEFTVDPLGMESEMTPGDPDYNPFEDPEVDELELDRLLWGDQ